MSDEIKVAALYKFIGLEDYTAIQKPLQAVCDEAGIMGTLLLADEGTNGTIAGSHEGIDSVLNWINSHNSIGPVEAKFSYTDEQPFLRMKVRLKKEIVALGAGRVDPNEYVGTYVEPEEWNELIEREDIILIDTRNDYEVAIGTFKNAIDPKTTTFREFPEYVENLKNDYPEGEKPKVAMFCTGGIRCEKASNFMMREGFDEVYHLKGGILKYLENIPKAESLWDGDCFVFDNRVSVRHGLEVGDYDMCHACRMPITQEDKSSEHFRAGISCPHCVGTRSEEDIKRFEERQKQMELAKQRGEAHIGSAARKESA